MLKWALFCRRGNAITEAGEEKKNRVLAKGERAEHGIEVLILTGIEGGNWLESGRIRLAVEWI